MWSRWSHVLAPLTQPSGRGTFEWTREHQVPFDEMRNLLLQDVMLAYPDINQPFDIYADASDYQMGATILQDGKPIAYWSRKLSAAQLNYSTMERSFSR